MSTTTTKYGLVKPELTDPADITALNGNWDKIDTELNNKFDKTGGSVTGDVSLQKAYPAMKLNASDTSYARLYKNANQSEDFGTSLSDYNKNGNSAELVLRADAQKMQLKLNGQTYDVYGTHNKPKATDVGAIPTNGGTMSGDLVFQKATNGSASVFKNHSTTSDYGLVLRDKSASNRTAELAIIASTGDLIFTNNGTAHEVYHAGNKPTPEEIGAMPMTVTNAVVG